MGIASSNTAHDAQHEGYVQNNQGHIHARTNNHPETVARNASSKSSRNPDFNA